jgi:hypothetical protein
MTTNCLKTGAVATLVYQIYLRQWTMSHKDIYTMLLSFITGRVPCHTALLYKLFRLELTVESTRNCKPYIRL